MTADSERVWVYDEESPSSVERGDVFPTILVCSLRRICARISFLAIIFAACGKEYSFLLVLRGCFSMVCWLMLRVYCMFMRDTWW